MGEIKVKPLEWTELTHERGDGTREPNGDWEAETPFGHYEIEMVTDPLSDTVVWGLTFNFEDGYIGGDHAAPDDAKAAAQAHFEARVRSIIEPETPSMWAEVTRDDFNGQIVWYCQERDGRGEITDQKVVELDAATFPIGTKLAITEAALTPEA